MESLATNYVAYKSKQSQRAAMNCYKEILANWPVIKESVYIETSFGATHVLVSGDKSLRPLVMLHGAGGNSGMWLHNIEELSEHFCIYAIDIIGEPGMSIGARPAYATDKHSVWLKEVIDGLDLQKISLCGISLGGWLSCRFAINHPDVVSELVLLSPPAIVNTNSEFLFRTVMTSFIPTRSTIIGFVRYISHRAKSMDDSELQNFVTTIQAYNPNTNYIPSLSNEDLNAMPAKTLMLLGQDEVMYCANEAAERVSSKTNNIKVLVLPQAGHIISFDQPSLVSEAIINFLKN